MSIYTRTGLGLFLACYFFMMGSSLLKAQTPLPETDIYLVEFKVEKGKYVFSRPQNITHRPGYDNQPFFLPDGRSLLYVRVPEGRRAEVMKFDEKTGGAEVMNRTGFDEYSPQLSPDGKNVSFVSLEKDSAQRIWQFPLKGGDCSNLIPAVSKVGYYCWASSNLLAMQLLGQPDRLLAYNLKTNKMDTIAQKPGRCIQKIPEKNAISYVDKQSDKEWKIVSFDLKTMQSAPIATTLPGCEDYAWSPDGVIFAGKEGKLYRFDPAKDRDWIKIADFSETPIKDFYRIAINSKGDRMALVSFSGTRP